MTQLSSVVLGGLTTDYGVYGRPEDHGASLGLYSVSNRGAFSTEGHLHMVILKRTDNAETWLWQVENNRPWSWEIGDWKDSVNLAAGGPVETNRDWRQNLFPGQEFTTVPVALCHVLDNYERAYADMTMPVTDAAEAPGSQLVTNHLQIT